MLLSDPCFNVWRSSCSPANLKYLAEFNRIPSHCSTARELVTAISYLDLAVARIPPIKKILPVGSLSETSFVFIFIDSYLSYDHLFILELTSKHSTTKFFYFFYD